MNPTAARVRATDRSGEWPGTLAAASTLAILVIAPVAWGCVSGLDRSVLTMLLCGLGALGCKSMLLRGTRLRWSYGTLPLACFAGLAFLQCLPMGVTLPDGLAVIAGIDHSPTLSLVPTVTASRARESIALLVVFCSSAQLLSHPRRIKRLPWALLILGSLVAIYYLANPFLEHVPTNAGAAFAGDGHVFGTYLNRNHLAALFVLAILMGTGLFVTRHRTLVHRSDSFSRRQWFIVLMCAACGAGLIATNSRGGITSCAAGALTLTVLQLRRVVWKRRLLPAVCIFACLAAIGLALPDELLQRFRGVGTELAAGTRPEIWSGALDLFKAAPLFGTGLGTFGEVSVLTQQPTVVDHVQHAHNDPLEFLAETGIVGANLLIWAAFAWLLPVWRRSGRTRGDRRSALASASIAAIVAICMHALVDFPLQVPALTCWVAALAGAASGAMANAHGMTPRDDRLPRWTLVPIVIALGFCTVFAGREAWSRHVVAQEPAPADLARAHAVHPAGGAARILEARARLALGNPARAVRAARDATALHPFSSSAWELLGLGLLGTGDAAASSALARCVALTPPGHREQRRTELGLAILRARRADIARAWFQELLADPETNAMAVLRQLHRDAPPDIDLSPLIPQDATPLLEEYAALLLRRGEFDRREAVLDRLLDRTPLGGSFTIRDRVRLTNKKFHVVRETTSDRVDVSFEFLAPSGYRFDSQMMCVSAHGEAAQAELWFRPKVGATELSFALPPHLPPGPYDLGLAAFTNGPRFPLAFLKVHERRASLLPGATVDPRALLYLETHPPRALPPDEPGLPLRPDDRSWRRLHLGEAGGELVIESTDPVAVRLDDRDLPYLGRFGAAGYRFALPRDRAVGTIEIRNRGRAVLRILRVGRIAGGAR